MHHKSKNLEGTEKVFVDRHHRTRIVVLASIVRGREHSDELLVCKELVAVLKDLDTSAKT